MLISDFLVNCMQWYIINIYFLHWTRINYIYQQQTIRYDSISWTWIHLFYFSFVMHFVWLLPSKLEINRTENSYHAVKLCILFLKSWLLLKFKWREKMMIIFTLHKISIRLATHWITCIDNYIRTSVSHWHEFVFWIFKCE